MWWKTEVTKSPQWKKRKQTTNACNSFGINSKKWSRGRIQTIDVAFPSLPPSAIIYSGVKLTLRRRPLPQWSTRGIMFIPESLPSLPRLQLLPHSWLPFLESGSQQICWSAWRWEWCRRVGRTPAALRFASKGPTTARSDGADHHTNAAHWRYKAKLRSWTCILSVLRFRLVSVCCVPIQLHQPVFFTFSENNAIF